MRKKVIFHCIYILYTYLSPVYSGNYGRLNYNHSQNFKEIIRHFEASLIEQCYIKINGPSVVIGNWKIYEPAYLLEIKGKDLKKFLSHEERLFKLKEMKDIPLAATKFFVETLTIESLKGTMKVLKDSVHWNLHGFYIVKSIPVINTCSLAYSLLKVFWDFKVLNVVYMCYHISSGIYLYTFNPYNSVAPKNWRKDKSFVQANRHPLTVFKFLVDSSEHSQADIASICNVLMLDKTSNLSNYPVRVAEISYIFKVPNIPNKRINVLYDVSGFARIIWKQLRAKAIVKHITVRDIGIIDINHTLTGVMKDIIEGTLESRSTIDYQRVWQYESYLQLEKGMCYVIKKPSFSLIEQLTEIFPLKIRVMLLLYSLIVMIIFAYILRTDYLNAILEVLRATLGTSTIYSPLTTLKNLVFIWIIFIFLIIGVYLQSQLTALVFRRKTRATDINSYEDILANNYKVYSSVISRQYFEKTALFEKIELTTDLDKCFNMVKTGLHVACIHDCLLIKYDIAEGGDLQILRDNMLSHNMVYFFREDSPLIRKFQWLSNILAENGIVHYIFTVKRSYYYRHPFVDSNYQITIYQMRYIFFFVITMYFIGTLAFLIEVSIKPFWSFI